MKQLAGILLTGLTGLLLVALSPAAAAQTTCDGLPYNEALAQGCAPTTAPDDGNPTTRSAALQAPSIDGPSNITSGGSASSSPFDVPAAVAGSGETASETAATLNGTTQVAFTGSSSGLVAAFASAIVLGGGALVIAARHRAEDEHPDH